MLPRVFNRCANPTCDLLQIERTTRNNRPQRNWQTRIGLPPIAHISQEGQSKVLIRKACLMNHEPRINQAIANGWHDLMEWHHDDLTDATWDILSSPQAEQQISSGSLTRHGNPFARQR